MTALCGQGSAVQAGHAGGRPRAVLQTSPTCQRLPPGPPTPTPPSHAGVHAATPRRCTGWTIPMPCRDRIAGGQVRRSPERRLARCRAGHLLGWRLGLRCRRCLAGLGPPARGRQARADATRRVAVGHRLHGAGSGTWVQRGMHERGSGAPDIRAGAPCGRRCGGASGRPWRSGQLSVVLPLTL